LLDFKLQIVNGHIHAKLFAHPLQFYGERFHKPILSPRVLARDEDGHRQRGG
jgi:hypothetical protein